MPTIIENQLKRIWGIEYEEIFDGQFLIWRAKIKNPFKVDLGWTVGLNEKFLREAMRIGVNKFILEVGQREIMMEVPDRKQLETKDKEKEFEMKPSLFEKSPAMKIYHFKL